MAETDFGRVLRELREARGLTQTALAASAGMHRQVVAKLELGTNEPSWPSVIKLAEALGVNVSVFTGKKPATGRTRTKRKRS